MGCSEGNYSSEGNYGDYGRKDTFFYTSCSVEMVKLN